MRFTQLLHNEVFANFPQITWQHTFAIFRKRPYEVWHEQNLSDVPCKDTEGGTASAIPHITGCLSLTQFNMVQTAEMLAVELISQCEREPNNGTLQ